MGVHTFPKGICPKENVISRLEFELAYFDFAVHRFNQWHHEDTAPSALVLLVINNVILKKNQIKKICVIRRKILQICKNGQSNLTLFQFLRYFNETILKRQLMCKRESLFINIVYYMYYLFLVKKNNASIYF